MSTLLDRVVDDAAIFPPGNAPLDVAIRDHLSHRAASYAAMVGPLLVRETDVEQVVALAERPLEIGVIATTGPSALQRAVVALHDGPHLRVTGFEIPLPAGELSAVGTLLAELKPPPGVTVSVELPRPGATVPDAWLAAAADVAEAGCQVKLRTGGVHPDAHPGERELAMVLEALVPHRFKLTAGLHRAVRHTQPGTGFEQHGFLNVMVAVHRLLGGASVDAAAEVLADREGARLAAEARSWSDADAAAVRQSFRGFGSCSIIEPHDDLVGLELIA
ncbi:hypothetical protein [Aeromicrobium sp. NPDC092404]|uniref:hypothetical protein n=1 Tax=Aeromicrobium sp. NPDC092404 TaxID=3154976 RepID=UPI00343C869F